ncbi:cytochrome-c peroxidase [Sulfurospirillum sp. 1612]|uniref:cytochrome-c peroxidase n=1 Tax=Sulfurospirillum sp. 1612 TaxID=3094835 RepID=UPI002F921874
MNYVVILIYFTCFNLVLLAQPITPIPRNNTIDNAQKIRLGKQLFFDQSLSKNNQISCASCHRHQYATADNRRNSPYSDNKTNPINTPTLYNSKYNFTQFYDGRASTLEEAITLMIEQNDTMQSNISDLAKKLNHTAYKKRFEAIYHDRVKPKYISNAIAAYIKTLNTPNAPFDKYLRGDDTALSASQKRGYFLFQSKGCIICHNGVNLGGNLFAKFGEIKPLLSDYLGRYNITKDPHDKYFYKVPTLRNISKTAPYMHDGRFYSLRDVVQFMLQYQLDAYGNRQDIDDIVDFLHALDGEVPHDVQ